MENIQIIEKVKSTIDKFKMFRRQDRVLVGLSGGKDSVTLLYILNALKKDYEIELYVAHLDHKIRGEDSRKDREFCEALTKRLGLVIESGEADVSDLTKEKGLSLEEAARIERYNFFKYVAQKNSIKKIAVGHTRDDQVETVLMRMIRGSGMMGLSGISPVREIFGLTVVRPLIEVSRSEIEEFVKSNKLEFRHDATNDEIIFTRNKIRHELLPYLEENFNPNIKEILSNMADNLRSENDFIEKFSIRKFRSISTRKDGEIILDLKGLKRQHVAIQKRILRTAIRELKGNLRRLTYQHWKELEDLIDYMPAGSKLDLPSGIDVVKKRDCIIFKPGLS